jgi:hypothetical protein
MLASYCRSWVWKSKGPPIHDGGFLSLMRNAVEGGTQLKSRQFIGQAIRLLRGGASWTVSALSYLLLLAC